MRRYDPLDRIISNELTATNVDAPQGTLVLEGCLATITAELEITVESGTIAINADSVGLSEQSETVSELSANEYRYVTVSVDDTGSAVVQEGNVGTLDSTGDVDNEVSEPTYPEGNVYLGTGIQFEDGLNTLWDGRYLDEYSHIPSGIITMWSGSIAEIPVGWQLCDGTNGTPDLLNRFIVGAGGEYDVDGTGGESEVQLTEAEMPVHRHTEDGDTDTGDVDVMVDDDGVTRVRFVNEQETGPAGGDEPHENRPPYYALAYIQKL